VHTRDQKPRVDELKELGVIPSFYNLYEYAGLDGVKEGDDLVFWCTQVMLPESDDEDFANYELCLGEENRIALYAAGERSNDEQRLKEGGSLVDDHSHKAAAGCVDRYATIFFNHFMKAVSQHNVFPPQLVLLWIKSASSAQSRRPRRTHERASQ
jgi:hypothetical protein